MAQVYIFTDGKLIDGLLSGERPAFSSAQDARVVLFEPGDDQTVEFIVIRSGSAKRARFPVS